MRGVYHAKVFHDGVEDGTTEGIVAVACPVLAGADVFACAVHGFFIPRHELLRYRHEPPAPCFGLAVPDDDNAAPELTDAEKKARALSELDTQYAADKQELSAQYLDAAMSGDSDTMTAIKDELAALNAKYDADYAALDK